MAARSVLAGVAEATPKSGEGEVEMIRMLKSAKDSAVKARTQAFNQMKALIVTAPAELRETLVGLTAGALINLCKSFRPGRLDDPTAAAKYTLRSLARRYRQLSKEIHDLEGELERLTRTISPALVDSYGIGPDTAATLLVAAGSNPERLHSEASFASLCGVNPIPASSGKTNRHRLNRGGHRQANAALHRIVVVRLRYDPRTQSYMRRRTMEGMSKAGDHPLPQTLRGSRSLLCPTDLAPNSSSHDLTSIGASGSAGETLDPMRPVERFSGVGPESGTPRMAPARLRRPRRAPGPTRPPGPPPCQQAPLSQPRPGLGPPAASSGHPGLLMLLLQHVAYLGVSGIEGSRQRPALFPRVGLDCGRYSGQPGGATAPLKRDCRWSSMARQIRTGGVEGLRGELQEPCGQRIRR